jgi:lipopolysaccharide biosynthesis glycosyltransferase
MRKIYVWGAGHYGVLTALYLEQQGTRIRGFIDRNAGQIKKRLGLPVFELDEVLSDKNQNFQIIIAVLKEEAIKKIIETLSLAGLKNNIDFKISPLVPVPSEYFNSVEEEINYYKNLIKERPDIYFRDEKTAKHIADTWSGAVNKPKNLRFIENAIPVVLCANENFAPYLAVMLQSLLDNSNPQKIYHFIILEREFSIETKDCLISQIVKFPNCVIDFIDMASVFDEIPVVPPNGLDKRFSVDMFSRLFIPYWFDKYPKVIYLDCDMIAKADIAELYDLDISGFCLAAAVCQIVNWYLKCKDYMFFLESSSVFMFLENWFCYINSGVLVFDTQKFREKFSYQDLFSFAIYFTNRYVRHFGDQEILALLVKDDYFVLPPEWNYSWGIKINRSAKPNTKIFHFASGAKPWKNVPEIANHPDTLAYLDYAKDVPLFKNRHHSTWAGENVI